MFNKRSESLRQLIIIETSPQWLRRSEYDMPALGTIVEIIQQKVQYPEAFLRNFNHCSINDVSMFWAAFTEEYPEVGKTVKILPYSPEPSDEIFPYSAYPKKYKA